jgi:tetratricopeptide (TPR) repeat protein
MNRLICTAAAFAFLFNAVSAAPAPPPRSGLSKDEEALYAAAEQARQEAARVRQQLHLQADASEQREATRREVARLERRAAAEYARLAGLLERKTLSVSARRRTDEVIMKAGKAWFNAGEYARAIDFYERAARQSAAPQTRVEAWGGVVTCNALLKDVKKIRPYLQAIRKELPRLDKAESATWEQWVDKFEKDLQ